MVRMQLYLDEELHALLEELARRQGRTVSDLVGDALARVYAPVGPDQRLSTLRAVEGIWRDRNDIEEAGAYVRRLRRDTRSGRKRSH